MNNNSSVLDELRKAFQALGRVRSPRLFALSATKTKTAPSTFVSRCVVLKPVDALVAFAAEVSIEYIGKPGTPAGATGLLSSSNIRGVEPYRGEWSNEFVFLADSDLPGLSCQVRAFRDSFLLPDCSRPVDEIEPTAMVLSANLGNGLGTAWFVSTRNPMQRLRHRFLKSGNSFKRIDKPILGLGKRVDALVLGDRVFFLDVSGAQMFVSEHICRAVAERHSKQVINTRLVSNPELFESVSNSGMNPRRFLSFNPSRLEALSRTGKDRRNIAALFGLKIDPCSGNIRIRDKYDAEQLIKVLCNRGMVDPFFENEPVEVAWSTRWRTRV